MVAGCLFIDVFLSFRMAASGTGSYGPSHHLLLDLLHHLPLPALHPLKGRPLLFHRHLPDPRQWVSSCPVCQITSGAASAYSHTPSFSVSFLQACLWWVGPSSTQWWVQSGKVTMTIMDTPLFWLGWPSPSHSSVASFTSSWGRKNENLIFRDFWKRKHYSANRL